MQTFPSQKLIDSKISIISHQKDEKAEKRNAYLEKFLTVFGIVSILCDSVGLLDALVSSSSGYQLFHIALCIGEIAVFAAFLIVLNILERKK